MYSTYQRRVTVQLVHRPEDGLGRHGFTALDGAHDDGGGLPRHDSQADDGAKCKHGREAEGLV